MPLVLLVLAGACASTQPVFVPTDEASSKRAGGAFSAAYYQIQVGDKRYGDVKVWSPGPPRDADGAQGQRVQVEMRIRNDSAAPIELDLARTDVELLVDRDFVALPAAAQTDGESTVQPAGTQRLRLSYALPPKVALDDLEGYEFNWAIRTPDGSFTQSTPFVRRAPATMGAAYQPYYYASPFWYDPFWHGRYSRWW